MSLFQMKPHFTEHKMGKINLLLLFPKTGHNNNEPEHKSTRPASVERANAQLPHTLTQENVMKRLQDWKEKKGPECNVSLLDELSASGGDNPLLCSSFSEC